MIFLMKLCKDIRICLKIYLLHLDLFIIIYFDFNKFINCFKEFIIVNICLIELYYKLLNIYLKTFNDKQ